MHVFVQARDDFPDHTLEPIGIGQGDPGGATHTDGLKILRPHHRAHASPASGAPVVVHHGGHLDQVLARRADAGHARLRLAQRLAHPFLRHV